MLYLLHQAIDRAAERDAEREAVRCRGKGISYAELCRQANGLAHTLVAEGIRRGDRVGIYGQKGLESAVAIYGIMKAGAAYVPLDPGAPLARVLKIVESCRMRAIVTEPSKREAIGRLSAEKTTVDCIIGIEAVDGSGDRAVPWSVIEAAATDSAPELGVMEQDLAYVLYTSGSTGTPKGIMHTHRSALSWAEVSSKAYDFKPTDRLSNHAPLHFDLSTLDYFATAVAGATTVIIPEPYTKLPASLSKLMADEKLTVFYAVPFALIQLLLYGALETRDLSSLRWVLFGGEPFPPKHLRALMQKLPGAGFVNVYGPTEVNGCTHFPLPPLSERSDEPIPIGRPYENVEALVVNADDESVAAGEIGELLIRAPTMMQGYWGNPELSERAVFRRTHDGGHEDVFHRTGDLVEVRPDDNFRFIGRKDRQVKVRGHRIELDEIEGALASHDSVAEAAVYLVADGEGSHAIHAAATPRTKTAPEEAELEKHLRKLLPWYAIPERIEVLEAFPRTSTGKIDRRSLIESAGETGSSGGVK